MGLSETLGQLKNPCSSPFGHSPPDSARAAYSAILSQSFMFNYSMPIYVLSYIIIIHIYGPTVLSNMEISAVLISILGLKRMDFT